MADMDNTAPDVTKTDTRFDRVTYVVQEQSMHGSPMFEEGEWYTSVELPEFLTEDEVKQRFKYLRAEYPHSVLRLLRITTPQGALFEVVS
jgi:hypothetical protein